MAPEQTQTLLSRRAWLARVGAAGALGAAAPFVASAPAAAAGDASIAGEVVGDAGAGRLLVSLEPDARVVTARVEGDRSLHTGDRVVFQPDADAATGRVFPLYFAIEGTVDSMTDSTVTVGAVECRLDGASLVYPSGRSDAAPAVARRSGRLSPGRRVSLLCVENAADRTRTIDAVYLG